MKVLPWLACAFLTPALSAELPLPRDGWASWQVAAVEGAPFWCCWVHEHDAAPSVCRLDGRAGGYTIRDRDTTTDTVKVYARFASGRIDSLQVFASGCPVEAKTTIQELGDVAADDSARWLIGRAREHGRDAVAHREIAEGALVALAMHRGDLARDALKVFARSDSRYEARKWSVFWLAMLRGSEGADITSDLMFGDKNADFRKHAAFALAQSKAPRVAPDLVRLGNSDEDGDVRAQAWFWLAHTGASGAEQAINAALRKDADENVREKAIFALSQLPGERATRALISTAEDQSLSREQRKRAVFWLSHSESDAARVYLDGIVARITDD